MIRFPHISPLSLCCLIAIGAMPAAAQGLPLGQRDYCSLAIPDYSAGTLPPKDAAADVIDDLLARGVQLTRQPDFRSIGVVNDPILAQRIAVAVICGGKDRYIFFDTGAIAEMKKSGGEWAKYFVFAHEIAHHMHLDPLTVNRDPQVELNADEDAAKWLTRMGASMSQIAKAIDALNPSDRRENGYPARCERIFAAIRGYNATARDYDRFAANMKLYQEGNCVLTAVLTPAPLPNSVPRAQPEDIGSYPTNPLVQIDWQWCRDSKAAGCGNYILGLRSEYGDSGAPKDLVRAVALYQIACDAGNGGACNTLGYHYDNGDGGISRDLTRAVALYKQACDSGYFGGCNNLGTKYENGDGGLPKDLTRAVALFKQSCDAGVLYGCANLAPKYEHGEGGLPRSLTRAVALSKQACNGGIPFACNNLGLLYEHGRGGLPKDSTHAVMVFKKACDGGDEEGCSNAKRLQGR